MIRFSKEGKRQLAKLGRKGDSFEDVIFKRMNPIDRKLNKLWRDQAKRRREFSKKQQKRREKK